jgi:hypothetical protein
MGVYADPGDPSNISGLKLVYSSDCNDGRPDQEMLLGTDGAGFGFVEYGIDITKKIVMISPCYNPTDEFIEDIKLTFEDKTFASLRSSPLCETPGSF